MKTSKIVCWVLVCLVLVCTVTLTASHKKLNSLKSTYAESLSSETSTTEPIEYEKVDIKDVFDDTYNYKDKNITVEGIITGISDTGEEIKLGTDLSSYKYHQHSINCVTDDEALKTIIKKAYLNTAAEVSGHVSNVSDTSVTIIIDTINT